MKERIVEKLRSAFSSSVLAVEEFAGDFIVTVRKSDLVQVARFLRDDEDLMFDSLRDIVAIDQSRPEDRFEVVYNMYSLPNNYRFMVKTRVDEADAVLPSLSGIWPAADWMEREAFDMMGIVFEGHPDLRRIYMPEEFEHFPLRKEFPLMGIPGSLPLPQK